MCWAEYSELYTCSHIVIVSPGVICSEHQSGTCPWVPDRMLLRGHRCPSCRENPFRPPPPSPQADIDNWYRKEVIFSSLEETWNTHIPVNIPSIDFATARAYAEESTLADLLINCPQLFETGISREYIDRIACRVRNLCDALWSLTEREPHNRNYTIRLREFLMGFYRIPTDAVKRWPLKDIEQFIKFAEGYLEHIRDVDEYELIAARYPWGLANKILDLLRFVRGASHTGQFRHDWMQALFLNLRFWQVYRENSPAPPSKKALEAAIRECLLTRVSIDSPGDDEGAQICHICYKPFGVGEGDEEPEQPVRLPCGHILGEACLLNWLLSSERQTCPLDRQDFTQTLRLHLNGAN